MSLSAGTAWNESVALARRAAGPLFGIAFLLIALPAAILQAAAPVTAPGRLPQPGLWLLLVPAALAASLAGALAICRLALGEEERAGPALAAALRRLPALLGAALLVALAGLLLLAATIFVAVALGSIVPMLALLPFLLFFWVRLVLLTPVAAAESLGPLALLRRSWAVTAGHLPTLTVVLIVLIAMSLLALAAAGAAGGIAARLAPGQPQPSLLAVLLALIVSALLQAAVSGFSAALLARVYAQFAADRAEADR